MVLFGSQEVLRTEAYPRPTLPQSEATPVQGQDVKHTIANIQSEDWFVIMDLKDAYFYVSVHP